MEKIKNKGGRGTYMDYRWTSGRIHLSPRTKINFHRQKSISHGQVQKLKKKAKKEEDKRKKKEK